MFSLQPESWLATNGMGMFKKVRSARPQARWRAERTRQYVSTTKGRERSWRPFSTFAQEEVDRGY